MHYYAKQERHILEISKNSYANYQLNHFLQDESFIDWVLNGKPEAAIWHSRLKKNKALQPTAKQAETLIKKIKPGKPQYEEDRIERLKMRIDEGIDKPISSRRKSSLPWNTNYSKILLAVAACFAFIIVVIFILLPGQVKEDQFTAEKVVWEKKTTQNGQKLTIFLSDGSRVKLNAGSEIQYQKLFNDSARVIKLTGEAFFEVARDTLRPFKVFAGSTVTQALGTSFNIHTEAGEVDIALVTGKVRITDIHDEKHRSYLNPGEKLKVADSHWNDIKTFDYFEEIAWKDDVLVFNNACSKEVFDRLEVWYGVQFNLRAYSQNQPWNYSGRFKNQTLKSVLMSISYSENFDFSINQKEIIITPMK